MPDISKITLPSGTTYDIKDTVARQAIGGGVVYIGVSSTAITDGGSEKPTIGGVVTTPLNGNLVVYGASEFIFGGDYGDGGTWSEFGDMSNLGALAYKDDASASYTPAGSVSAPSISVSSAGSTTNIKNPTSKTVATAVATAAPGQTAPSNAVTVFSVTGEVLSLYQVGYTTGDSISTSNVTVKTGDADYAATAPTFTGTAATITVD